MSALWRIRLCTALWCAVLGGVAVAQTDPPSDGGVTTETQPGVPASAPAPETSQAEAQLRAETAEQATRQAAEQLEAVRQEIEKTQLEAADARRPEEVARRQAELEFEAQLLERRGRIAELRKKYAEELERSALDEQEALQAIERIDRETRARALGEIDATGRDTLRERLTTRLSEIAARAEQLRQDKAGFLANVADLQDEGRRLRDARDANTLAVSAQRVQEALEQLELRIAYRRLIGYALGDQAETAARVAAAHARGLAALDAYEGRFWIQNAYLLQSLLIFIYGVLATGGLDVLRWILSRLVLDSLARRNHGRALPRIKRLQTLGQFVTSICKLFIWVAVVVTVLAQFDISPGQTAGALGVIGLVLAGMFQHLVIDFVKGIDIAIGGHYFVGDYIEVAGTSGHVLDFNVKYTTIRTSSGQNVILPNSQCVPSRRFPSGFVDNYVDLPLARPADAKRAQQIVERVGAALNRQVEVIRERPLVVETFPDVDALRMRVCLRVLPACDWAIKEHFLPRVSAALAVAEIELAGEPTHFFLNDLPTLRRLFSREVTAQDIEQVRLAERRPTLEQLDAQPSVAHEANANDSGRS